jgi:uncharacterized protein YecE (DUF72 family)
MIQWHIGCSGFHYKDWKGIFYPKDVPQRLWFEYYCTHFNTLELNVTFYRFPLISMLESWYKRSPSGFSFSVKAPKLITHFRKMNDCDALLQDFYNTVGEGLKEKAACILFQFPPSYIYTEERLENIINSLNSKFANVVEFRHASWWNEKVYEKLRQSKISFSGMSHPLLPDKVIANTSVLYYRMHGVPDLYRSSYSSISLKKIVKEIKALVNLKEAFIYFNNDYGGVGIKNAKTMIDFLQIK